jgi:hypothetical protein
MIQQMDIVVPLHRRLTRGQPERGKTIIDIGDSRRQQDPNGNAGHHATMR